MESSPSAVFVLLHPYTRMLIGVCVCALMAVRATHTQHRSLSLTGAAAAVCVGVCTYACSHILAALLLAFYITGSAFTKYKSQIKSQWDLEIRGGAGARTATQVCATAGVCALMCVRLCVWSATNLWVVYGLQKRLAADAGGSADVDVGAQAAAALNGSEIFRHRLPGTGEAWWDVPLLHMAGNAPQHGRGAASATGPAAYPLPSQVLLACVAAYACVTGDTWASELGVLSSSPPLLLTSICGLGACGAGGRSNKIGKRPRACCRRVPRGTNGGVSAWGTFVSALGGAFIGLVAWLAVTLQDLLYASPGAVDGTPQWLLVPVGAAAGLFGSIIDSVMGAWCQRSWYDAASGKATSRLPEENAGADGYEIVEDSYENALAADDTAAPQQANKSKPAVVKHKFLPVCGLDILTNEQVNFLSAAITAYAFAQGLPRLLPRILGA